MANSRRGSFLVIGLIGMAAAALGACGDNGNTGDPRGPFAEFTGSWKYTQSMATFSCPGQADQTGTLGTAKDWGEGVKSDLVDLTTSCGYRFDVTDKVATIEAGQTCSFDDGQGGTSLEAPSSWVFTLRSATTADETLTTVIDSVCTLTGVATLEKISKD